MAKLERFLLTNPALIALRLRTIKETAHLVNAELAQEFGVRELTMLRWVNGRHAPRSKHQRTLEAIERKYGLRDSEGVLKNG